MEQTEVSKRRRICESCSLDLAMIPNLGTVVLRMGNESSESIQTGISSALFTSVQERLLGLIFGQPRRRFQSSELIDLVGAGTGAREFRIRR